MNILFISSSIFSSEGKSSTLADHFLQQIQQRHPEAKVTVRDLAKEAIPHLTADTFQAALTAPENRSPEQQQRAALADTLVEELLAADILVLGVPMYNFGIPSTLKAWIDHVARAGTTFKYTENGPVGLVKNTRAYVLGARGGAYANTPNDTQTPYLKTFLAFVGITDVEFVLAEKLNLHSEQAEEIIQQAKNQIDQLLES